MRSITRYIVCILLIDWNGVAVKVENIMTTSVVTVGMDDSLHIIRDIFRREGFHHLFVVEHDKLIGIISDRDLLKSLSPYMGTAAEKERDVIILNRRAHQIMTRDPITLLPDAEAQDAASVFNEHDVSCIPVVDEGNTLLGVLSWRDLLQFIQG